MLGGWADSPQDMVIPRTDLGVSAFEEDSIVEVRVLGFANDLGRLPSNPHQLCGLQCQVRGPFED